MPDMVAPHAGAWIEISIANAKPISGLVAPHAGAWIEITGYRVARLGGYVAPHAGAWIEISDGNITITLNGRRPSRRGVD